MSFHQTTDLVEKLRAQNVTFEELIIPTKFTTALPQRLLSLSRYHRFFNRKLMPQANGNKSTARTAAGSKYVFKYRDYLIQNGTRWTRTEQNAFGVRSDPGDLTHVFHVISSGSCGRVDLPVIVPR